MQNFEKVGKSLSQHLMYMRIRMNCLGKTSSSMCIEGQMAWKNKFRQGSKAGAFCIVVFNAYAEFLHVMFV